MTKTQFSKRLLTAKSKASFINTAKTPQPFRKQLLRRRLNQTLHLKCQGNVRNVLKVKKTKAANREAQLVIATHWTVCKASNGTITDDIAQRNIHTDWIISTAAEPEINKSIMHSHMIASSFGSSLYFSRTQVLHS